MPNAATPAATPATAVAVAVGTTNPTKLNAVRAAVAAVFPGAAVSVTGVAVPSGIRDQPMSDEETLRGAHNRAAAALAAHPGADFGVGIEGGVQRVLDKWFESGWVVVVDKTGKSGIGSSARLELSSVFMDRLNQGVELAHVVDELTGQTDVRSAQGVMGK
ncbi:hypothetical protein HK405_011442 [Cladochytrium tenue]|nr:hypothetical protein HK405_011442 [Cladochytrium tenue]